MKVANCGRRECNRDSHLPKTCAEAARSSDDERTRMRCFIENKIAEALMRNCPKCKTPLVVVHCEWIKVRYDGVL